MKLSEYFRYRQAIFGLYGLSWILSAVFLAAIEGSCSADFGG